MSESLQEQVTGTLGSSGLIAIIVSLICIGLSFWALQNLKLDLIVRQHKGPQGRLLHLLLAIVLGHFVAKFIIDYLSWSQMIKFMF
ncbi:DUF1146 family protein [Paenibacillus pini]|uniref:DUF1146 family protein n=1 Tax=Paenibacillus pini TaxID=669461 RepID=UPI00056743D1|nr:DUF1146 family protein [Paenibacillus pini]